MWPLASTRARIGDGDGDGDGVLWMADWIGLVVADVSAIRRGCLRTGRWALITITSRCHNRGGSGLEWQIPDKLCAH